jgi:hypothetical protein
MGGHRANVFALSLVSSSRGGGSDSSFPGILEGLSLPPTHLGQRRSVDIQGSPHPSQPGTPANHFALSLDGLFSAYRTLWGP